MAGIRIGGLASGMDTESIVKKLMDAERIPLNKLKQKKQKDEWKRDSYREMNSLLLELQKKADEMRYQAMFTKKKVMSSDESRVTLSSNGTPNLASYSITNVKLGSTGNGASVKFANSMPDSVTQFENKGMTGDFTFTLSDGTSSGASITINQTDNINTAIQKINAQSDTTGVKAVYSATEKSIVFSSTTPGNGIKISNVLGSSPLNISEGEISAVDSNGNTAINDFMGNGYPGQKEVKGSAAINGVVYEFTGNMLTVDGVTFSFKTDFTTPVTVSAVTDMDAVVGNIKGFVDKYNEIIAKLNSEISEVANRKYQPLTDADKEGLTDDQIKKLEDKAKEGILQGDSTIRRVLNAMRESFYTAVSGVDVGSDTLSKIGIGTAKADGNKYNYLENGKMHIDEEKLRQSLAENPDAVMNLFTKKGSTFQEKGIAGRLTEQLNDAINQIKKKAGSSTTKSYADYDMGINLKRYDEQITRWEDRLTQKEDYYYKKFAAMETALNKYNSQSAWLTSKTS
ncbi:flagellar filament capping protein FliD [Brevibacillus sp. SIMBA_040]|uniref:flagellar filament capping protein FliD n=2 Tax=Bacteria TaxID=2 RepID=UPI00397BAEA8